MKSTVVDESLSSNKTNVLFQRILQGSLVGVCTGRSNGNVSLPVYLGIIPSTFIETGMVFCLSTEHILSDGEIILESLTDSTGTVVSLKTAALLVLLFFSRYSN